MEAPFFRQRTGLLRTTNPSPAQRREGTKKVLLTFWVAAFWFMVFQPVYADPSWQSPDPDVSLLHFPVKFVDDLPHLFISDNAVPFITGSLLTASDWAFFDQHDSFAAALQWKTPGLFNFGNFYGEGWVEGGLAVGSWSWGAFTQDQRLQEFGRDAAESLVTAALVAKGLKYAVGRERPDGLNNLSFPSGHALTAFCFAPVVAKYGGWEMGVSAYTLATVTALARVQGYHHYLSDVLAGATLGIVIGNATVYAPKDVSVSAGPGQMSLKLVFN
jgi:membrane-associated phospholipid phosphatase